MLGLLFYGCMCLGLGVRDMFDVLGYNYGLVLRICLRF